tara:strand:+ start:36 stop:515 length:480 start_codon:yes stop_codon:yes gene_type:complete
MFKIIDSYLKIEEHLVLTTLMESNEFPWFYFEKKVSNDEGLFKSQFSHHFYRDNNINSEYFTHLKPILDKLKPLALVRVKANLNPPSEKIVESAYHIDQKFKCKIAIYYLNDNDGYTLIGKEKILSKKNRMVLFNSDVEHIGTNSTNCNNRMVINFNYF